MLSGLLLAVLAGTTPAASPWAPPRNPDPQRILGEATQDTRAGRHDVALAKFVWFHQNALKHEPALAGVRLSFALSDWYDLGQAYPPALEALKRTRDAALKDVRERQGDDVFQPFQDLAAINEKLGEESLTATTFIALAARRPDAAPLVFRVARPSLLRAKEYTLCGKYLSPEEDWHMAAELYQLGRRQQQQFGPEHADFVEKSFTNEVATLLALLVVNGRPAEAEAIARKARLEWDDPGFRAAIDSALGGVIPEPWP